MRSGTRIRRQRVRVKRRQYLVLALVILAGAAILVGYVNGYLLGLPDPIPG